MAFTFDGANKRIILDTATTSSAEIWSQWVDWHMGNPEWLMAFNQIGGQDLGGGLSIPPYFFLINGWRVRPMESSHTLTITGNLFVDGGGDPIVPTLGVYNVLVKSVVPVQAQGISTSGSTGPTAADIWQHPVEGVYSAEEVVRLMAAALAGKVNGADTTTINFRDLADTKNRITAIVDASGNRTAITYDVQ